MDPHFDLEYHTRELALPEPGDDKRSGEQVARIASRHLDRKRPLWELYLIQGLPDGRCALLSKMHHAMVDERPQMKAPETPFSGSISAHRRFSFGSVSLEEIKDVKNGLDVKPNDDVVAVCAIRRWLKLPPRRDLAEASGGLPAKLLLDRGGHHPAEAREQRLARERP